MEITLLYQAVILFSVERGFFMESARPPASNRMQQSGDTEEVTQKLFSVQTSNKRGKLEQRPADSTETGASVLANGHLEAAGDEQIDSFEALDGPGTINLPAVDEAEATDTSIEVLDTLSIPAQTEIGTLPE